MMTLSISTNDPTYKTNKTNAETLLVYLNSVFPYFKELSLEEQKMWLNKDLLLKIIFDISAVVAKQYPDFYERHSL